VVSFTCALQGLQGQSRDQPSPIYSREATGATDASPLLAEHTLSLVGELGNSRLKGSRRRCGRHAQDHIRGRGGAFLEQTLRLQSSTRLWSRGYSEHGGSGGQSLKYSWQ
jgi:hypothetical protein